VHLNVNFNVFFKLIKVHLLVSELHLLNLFQTGLVIRSREFLCLRIGGDDATLTISM